MDDIQSNMKTPPGNAPSQADELLDVVDCRDNISGIATRGRIHREGLLHRAAHIFLFNGSGEIYVQRRSKWKDRYPLKLDSSAAGHVGTGESYLVTAKRELLEELGIEAEVTEILKVLACPATDNEHVVLYEASSDVRPVPNDEEIVEGWFMKPSELSQIMRTRQDDFVPAFVLLWKLFNEKSIS